MTLMPAVITEPGVSRPTTCDAMVRPFNEPGSGCVRSPTPAHREIIRVLGSARLCAIPFQAGYKIGVSGSAVRESFRSGSAPSA